MQNSDAAPMATEDSDIPTTDYDSDIEVRSYIFNCPTPVFQLSCFWDEKVNVYIQFYISRGTITG